MPEYQDSMRRMKNALKSYKHGVSHVIRWEMGVKGQRVWHKKQERLMLQLWALVSNINTFHY